MTGLFAGVGRGGDNEGVGAATALSRSLNGASLGRRAYKGRGSERSVVPMKKEVFVSAPTQRIGVDVRTASMIPDTGGRTRVESPVMAFSLLLCTQGKWRVRWGPDDGHRKQRERNLVSDGEIRT